jgi:hypothetical protein
MVIFSSARQSIIYLLDGTAAAPSVTFIADDDTGMYRISSNIIGFSVNGTERLRITTTGMTLGTGTGNALIQASGISYTFSGDTDTGINRDNPNIMSLKAGNVSGLIIEQTKVTLPLNTYLTQGLRHAIATKSADYAILDTDGDLFLVDTTGGAVTITLPTMADNIGKKITITRLTAGANALTVDGEGAETINGAATQLIPTQYGSMSFTTEGVTGWYIIGRSIV